MYIRRKVFSVAIDEESGEERYFSTNEIINEEDYLDEVMYSDLEEREFGKNSIRYTKKLMKSAINETFKNAEKTGTPQLSNATQERLLRVNGKKAKNLMSMPKQMNISSKGIKKNSIRRLGQDPKVLKEAMPEVNEAMRQQAKYTANFINNAPDRNKAIAQVRSNARDVIKGGFFG